MSRVKKPIPADVSRAKGYVERIKRLIEQQKEIGGDISDVCTEAKENAGLDPTTLRFAAREWLMDEDKRSERDAKREQYLHAVGLAVAAVESGEVSARQAAKIYNIGKSSVYKALSVREVSAVEMTADDLGVVKPVPEMVADDLGDWRWIDRRKRADAEFAEKIRAIAARLKTADLDTPPSGGGERHGVKALCAQADSSADSLSGSTDRTCSVGIASEGLRTVPEAQGSGSGEPVSSPGPLDLDTTIPDFLRRRRA